MHLTDYRLSFVFHETLLEPLEKGAAPLPLPLPQTVHRANYQAAFDAAQKTRPAAADLAQPWPADGLQGFWEQYIEESLPLPKLSGALAWRNMVPWRLVPRIDIAHESPAVRVACEGFLHPWGATLVVTLAGQGPWDTLAPLRQHVVELRRKPCFRAGAARKTLEQVGDAGLDALRAAAFGPLAVGRRAEEPFSIFTVLQGEGTQAELDPNQADDIRRLLHAATTFSPTAEVDTLPALADRLVAGRRNGPSSHAVYGVSRGRAIWGPEHLQRAGARSLSCQHRNLVLASMQTESLGRLHQATVATSAGVAAMSVAHEAVARRATEKLRQLYLGQPSSFRSKSLTAQVEQAGWLADVNTLRGWLDVSTL